MRHIPLVKWHDNSSFFKAALFWGYPQKGMRLRLLELLICVVLIAILAFGALMSYRDYIKMFQSAPPILGAPFLERKIDMMTYHAHTGDWPANADQTCAWGVQNKYGNGDGSYLHDVSFEPGALHFKLSGTFEGKTVSMRPAVPLNNHLGPVVWFCGEPMDAQGWYLAGTDKTDLPMAYIPLNLR